MANYVSRLASKHHIGMLVAPVADLLLPETKGALLGQGVAKILSSCTPFLLLWVVLTNGAIFARSNGSCSLERRDYFLRT
jgi:hypothetical protein